MILILRMTSGRKRETGCRLENLLRLLSSRVFLLWFHLQTDWTQMRRRVTRRRIWVQCVWDPYSMFSNKNDYVWECIDIRVQETNCLIGWHLALQSGCWEFDSCQRSGFGLRYTWSKAIDNRQSVDSHLTRDISPRKFLSAPVKHYIVIYTCTSW